LENEIDCLCITVNPEHFDFYKFLGFDGDEKEIKTHPGVQAPAVFMAVEIEKWVREKTKKSNPKNAC